ncbi:Sterile alpha motif domain containing 11 [Mactra antiquata]
MAKRRSKNKAKRNFAGLDRKVQINGEIVEKMLKMEAQTKIDSEMNINSVSDLCEEVQLTENKLLTHGSMESDFDCKENAENILDTGNKPKGRKPNKNKPKKPQTKPVNDGNTTDEVIIYPTEVDGETCIDIKCGNNEAVLYLSKLCLGSKGACINFSDNWLTPNEFQSVSGRETAKDWKRSIRHKGRSLKLLISKGLITVQSVSPKKAAEKAIEKAINKDIKVSPVSPETAEPVGDGGDKPDGNDNTVEQRMAQDTGSAIIPKGKRGRKPKKGKHWKKGLRYKPSYENPIINPIGINTTFETKENIADDNEACTSMPENSDNKVEVIDAPVDTRTPEERRLDEFVKTLKLTKTIVPKQAPELSTIDKVKDERDPADDDEPEMPVLQKEADIPPAFQTTPSGQINQRDHISVSVDHFHATVTPPPTPPSDRPALDRKTDDEKLIETFKSRLASPSNGLKLTINREKIKAENGDDVLCKTVTTESVNGEKASMKTNIQSLLLQDALQSAKRYKEQLKQNLVTTPSSKPLIQIPEVVPVPKVFDHRKNLTMPQTIASSHYTASMHPSASIPSLAYSSSSSLLSNIPYPSVNRQLEKDRPNPFIQNGNDKHSNTKHETFSRRAPVQLPKLQTSPNGLPSMDIMQNLSGMSFQDFLTVVSSIYGPLPFPVDSKDAAFAALQEMHRRHDMSMLQLVAQGQLNGSASSLLYPMMTQQILLAMTQQFYSLYNVPNWSPTTKLPVPKEHSEMPVRRPAQPSPDISSSKKRKVNDTGDCALDLSVKRPKTEINRNFKPPSFPEVAQCDAPLDFSMKKVQYPYPYSDTNSKGMSSRINSLNGSLLDAEHLRRWSSQQNVVSKSVPVICSCASAVDDDVTSWSVEQVCYFLKNLDGCAGYAKTFHDQGISGKLLPYLTTQHLTRTLGMKVGPALTLIQAVKDRREKAFNSLTRRQECRIHRPTAVRAHI